MKYIDADKMIAEIERRMKDYNVSIEKYYNKQKSIKAERDSWKWAECKWFLSLITSLQQEQSEVDFEKEMDKFYDSPLWEGEDVSWMTYTRIAHHFYELGQQNRSTISNNSLKELRKEVIKFNQEHFDELHSDMDTIDIVHIVAVHFYELGKNARK